MKSENKVKYQQTKNHSIKSYLRNNAATKRIKRNEKLPNLSSVLKKHSRIPKMYTFFPKPRKHTNLLI